jgi:hypothetical protein
MEHMLVLCPECSAQQIEEIHNSEEKFGWNCEGCRAVLKYIPEEGVSHRHLLANDNSTRFTSSQGGNVCTSFGGLPGEIRRKLY